MKILVTGGPTREYLDPIRFISNPSSGKMGVAVAKAAKQKGHHVVLVTGPLMCQTPEGVQVISVETTEEMAHQVLKWFPRCDGVVMTAAVTDFKPKKTLNKKFKKKNKKNWDLRLTPTRDILATLGKRKGKKWLVGFAAETNNLVQNAQKKLKDKNLDLVVANNVNHRGAGFGVNTNIVQVFDKNGSSQKLPKMTKQKLAHWLIKKIERDIGGIAKW